MPEPVAVPLKRIVVVANKGFEADPLVHVLLSERGTPREQELGDVAWRSYPRLRKKEQRRRQQMPPATEPLITIGVPKAGRPHASVEIWCIEDMMNPAVSSSNTLEKARVLTNLFATAPADFVIAFGTAAIPEPRRFNGSVVVGSKVFVHDPYAGVADSNGLWTPPQPDVVLDSPGTPAKFFRELDENARYPAEGRFLRAPVRPARPARIVAGHPFVSLGTINVNDRYDEYAWADPETLAAFRSVTQAKLHVGSLETTHGVIRSCCGGTPFLYVSGIANTTTQFDFETTPRVYGQNLVASHNAAVTLAWLLPQLVEVL
jgi:hypothetical protein